MDVTKQRPVALKFTISALALCNDTSLRIQGIYLIKAAFIFEKIKPENFYFTKFSTKMNQKIIISALELDNPKYMHMKTTTWRR